MGEVVPLFPLSSSAAHTESISSATVPELRYTDTVRLAKTVEDTSTIYSALGEIVSSLSAAMRLLGEMDRLLSEAVDVAEADDNVGADDAVQRAQVLLPELFLCRDLGDGFASIVIALFYGLKSLKGAVITREQILILKRVVGALKKYPFIGYESALDLIALLDSVGFNVENPAMIEIQDALIG